MESKKPNKSCSLKDKYKTNFQVKRQYMPYISDTKLVPRVRQYLEDHNHPDSAIVDVDEMAEDLRARYPEYGRRKRGPFKQGVRSAFDLVYKTWGMTSDMSDYGVTSDMSDVSSASDKDADLDDEMEYQGTGDPMAAVYLMQSSTQQNKRKRSRSSDVEKELINISSDDETPKDDLSVQKNENGPAKALSLRALVPQMQSTIENSTPVKPAPLQKLASVVKGTPASGVTPKKKKKKWKEIDKRSPLVTFKDFGGSSKALEDVCKLLIHVRHPEVYNHIGITPPRGFLLHGPPGCGKTLLAHAIAGELGIPLMTVAGPELVAGVSGESEERIRDLFEQAAESAPCILFVDEVDAIAPNRHTVQREMERRIVAQFLSCLDELSRKEGGSEVVVIGATNRPDSLDPALRRAGRFDREVSLGIPDNKARINILQILCRDLKLAKDFDYNYVARNTPGFVGADLMALTREASMIAVNRVFGNLKQDVSDKQIEPNTSVHNSMVVEIENENVCAEGTSKETSQQSDSQKDDSSQNLNTKVENNPDRGNENTLQTPGWSKEVNELIVWLRDDKKPLSNEQLSKIQIGLNDFKQALKSVQPSSKREGFATVPDVTWDDIGSLNDIRQELQMTILAPVRYPDQFAELGIYTPSGVLLCGPPGCGKTLLAKAVANEAGINFISVKGPELLNMYVGESEKAVRQCFQRARNSAPCVIFFDELDALCPKRSDSGEGGASMRVVNQMLTEMDGIEGRKGVFLMAASNRPEIVDPAVLRPGRLDKILYIGLPSPTDRADILRALTKNGTRPVLDESIDLKSLGEGVECSGYTGADLAALVREAGIQALKEFMATSSDVKKLKVSNQHFIEAQKKIRPSVSEKDRKHYEMLQKLYSPMKS